MEPKGAIVGTFDIPDDLAKELSDLLVKQTIREKMLLQVIDDPNKYAMMEKMLIPITSRIEAIKVKITRDYVPEKFNSESYMWNYDGYEIDGNSVQVLHA